jgi:DNA-binding response OmpR family regulator
VRVLLVEDHKPLARGLRQGLEEEGFAVDLAHDGRAGDEKARTADYDVIVLDLMLPGEDGLSLLRRWRRDGLKCPVLILTARDAVEDRVRGLDGGADDYLTKPFSLDELLARVRALVRRGYQVRDPVVRVGDLEIDTGAHSVRRAGQPIALTATEYRLLEFLAFQAGKVVPETRIIEHLWDEADECLSNRVAVFISYLRAKIDRGFDRPLIHTRRGEGYVLSAEEG